MPNQHGLVTNGWKDSLYSIQDTPPFFPNMVGKEIFNIEELNNQNKGVFTKINTSNMYTVSGQILIQFSAILHG